MVSLREATAELHHAAEATPLGQRLAAGTVSPQEWLDLCHAYLVVHRELDPWLPPAAARSGLLLVDVAAAAPLRPRPVSAAANWAAELRQASWQEAGAAAYVLLGAHLMGGAAIARRMPPDMPRLHLSFRGPWREQLLDYIRDLRQCVALADAARGAFGRVVAIMTEIDEASS